MKRTAFALLVVFLSPALFAARSSAPKPLDPQQVAANEFRAGAYQLDRAAKIHARLAAAPESEKDGLEKKLNKALESAVRDFKRATDNDPRMVQAYSELGFALRKLGRFEESLAAYDKALAIMPTYSPAIEYRAEAYLGLNRVAEAKQAYLMLFSGDRPRADLLYAAMKRWAADHPDGDAAFAKWIAEREPLHATATQTASKDLRTW